MNFRISTKYRSNSKELMDDFSLEGEELREALDKIASINQLLGGNNVTLDGVKQLLRNVSPNETITIVDVGCGNGDLLRTLAQYAEQAGLLFELIGIDANRFTVNHAQLLSTDYKNISFRCEDIFDAAFQEVKADLFLCTLTLHHFKNEEIEYLLPLFYRNSRLGIVINDLHRSGLAYRLFQLLCFVFRLNTMSREDGLISILRGFTREELICYSNQMNFNKWSISWRWAFRYQWIISKL
ncbi:methyltransferase domain-containing protein [Flavobacterium sp. RSSA_27]|uniref:methyltransferase domain-containing protein n=1 Tax=Flavobacterium sp. RSSA_27 TaxID=3447667 RepID=UPI003F30A9EF